MVQNAKHSQDHYVQYVEGLAEHFWYFLGQLFVQMLSTTYYLLLSAQ